MSEQISEKRAGTIARCILEKYDAPRKSFEFNSRDSREETPEWVRLAKEFGEKPELVKAYCIKLSAIVLSEHFDTTIAVTTRDAAAGQITDDEMTRLALKLLQLKGCEINDLRNRCKRMSDVVGVPAEELEEFYIQFIIPAMFDRRLGRKVQIIK